MPPVGSLLLGLLVLTGNAHYVNGGILSVAQGCGLVVWGPLLYT